MCRGPGAPRNVTPLRKHGASMLIRDTSEGYGIVSRLFHWLMAIAIVAMFALGLWMVRLDYYSPYYNSAPDIHRSVGMLLLFALLVRWIWRVANVKPSDSELSPLEQKTSYIVHWGFYVLLFVLMASGYLISTAGGEPINVFGWFQVPSIFQMHGARKPRRLRSQNSGLRHHSARRCSWACRFEAPLHR